MRIMMGPAVREGKSKTIFHQQLKVDGIHHEKNGEVRVSVVAAGLYDESHYQYVLTFTGSEVAAMFRRPN